MKYILDTNIISAILNGNVKVKNNTQNVIDEGKNIFINALSYYEIKRGLLAINATSKLSKFESLCNTFGLVFFDNQYIFDKAAEIYEYLKCEGKLLEDADILIASLSISSNFILVTADTDFDRIKTLRVENWLN
jgi:tRNA(fMet)-specific endonuclease VapC